MLSLTKNEIAHLRTLNSELDYESYPPSYLVRLLCEYLISRGETSISTSDIQELFSAAQFTNWATKKEVKLTPGKIRNHLGGIAKKNTLPILHTENPDEWNIIHPIYQYHITLEVTSNDRLQASDLAKKVIPPGYTTDKLDISKNDCYKIELTVNTRYGTQTAIQASSFEYLRSLSKKWDLKFGTGIEFSARSENLNLRSITSCIFELRRLPK